MDALHTQAFTLLRAHMVVIDDVAYLPTEGAALALGLSVKTFRRRAKAHGMMPVIYRRVRLWRVEAVMALAQKDQHP